MLHIAICDDDIENLSAVIELVNEYRAEQNRALHYVAFESPFELITAIEKGLRFDMLLLDVVMPGLNGIEAAREIREYDTNVRIIFLTNSSEFAVQSYAVGAYFYQLKPIWRESFFRLMDMVFSEYAREQTDSIIMKCKMGITRIPLRTLEYCEVINKTVIFHLENGKALESMGNMADVSEKLLQYEAFIRPHRSYVVNMDYIESISYRAIIMACLAEIPIPRGKYEEIKNAFLRHAFQETEEKA